MRRTRCCLLFANVAKGILGFMPAVGLSAVLAADGGDRLAAGPQPADPPGTIRVSDQPRLAQLLGPAAQVVSPAARSVVPAVRAAIPAARPAVAAQGPPARVAPQSGSGAINARSENRGRGSARSHSTGTPSYETNDNAGLRAKWNREVEYPLQLGAIDRQITLARARLESYQQRLDRYAGYNAVAPPNAGAFRPSAVIPQFNTAYPLSFATPIPVLPAFGSEQQRAAASRYAPNELQAGGGPSRSPSNYPWTAVTPSRAFSPPSTFSHVLGEVQRREEEARLELDRLLKTREQFVANGADSLPPRMFSATSYERRLEALAAERQRADAYYQDMDARVLQYNVMNRQAYLVSFSDLRDKLSLGRLEAKLRLDGLDQERQVLQAHRTDWEQLRQASR